MENAFMKGTGRATGGGSGTTTDGTAIATGTTIGNATNAIATTIATTIGIKSDLAARSRNACATASGR
jgi:hypothetical protein